jgi:RNA polymerase sigma-70 factor (ECF subfamily)
MNVPVNSAREAFIPTRYSLLSRLQDWNDQESWKDFFDTYWRLIYSMARKSGLTDAEAQDVVQETVICVAKDIHKFRRDRSIGSFKGWLRNLTRWRIADHLRKRTRAAPDEDSGSEPYADCGKLAETPASWNADLERAWEAEWQANLMETALERIKHRVKEEHYQMFDLNVVRQWPAKQVAQTLEVNIAQVYLAKHRILALLKKEVRRLERQWSPIEK